MSKSNPTTRPDAPNYEVRDGIIHRYEPMTIAEAFRVLSESDSPLCGFRDADFQPWQSDHLYYVVPSAAEPFRVKGIGGVLSYKQCARVTTEDPRKVPDGVPELPKPWLALLANKRCVRGDYWAYPCTKVWKPLKGVNPSISENLEVPVAIDVRAAFARKHFPEYVEALGYPLEEAFPWSIGDKVKPIGSDTTGEVTAVSGGTAIVSFSDASCASFSHGMLEAAEDRIQLTDTQLLDKLAESEHTLPDGRQFWQVFTDRGDPQMTVREAIEAWGADE